MAAQHCLVVLLGVLTLKSYLGVFKGLDHNVTMFFQLKLVNMGGGG